MKPNHTKVIYPGTFDPVTYGHLDIIKRALRFFDNVIVAVAHSSTDKRPLFSITERVRMLRRATAGLSRVEVGDFKGLVVDYARRVRAGAMIRGIRMLSDFEYEFQMALTNRKLAADIETVFLMPHESYAYLSSRLIKEVASLKGDIHAFTPDFVVRAVEKKLKAR